MLTAPQRDIIREKGTLIGRVLLGLLFFWSGVGILFIQGPANTAAFYDGLGLPMAGFLVWLVIILKIVAGGAVMIGKRVGLASAALIIFTFLTILIAHRDISDINLFKNLAIIGGLLQLMAYGPGGTAK
jgi:putative oxidoreductase